MNRLHLTTGISLLLCFTCLIIACKDDAPLPVGLNPTPTMTSYDEANYQDLTIPDSVLYDKILGSLVGSAIGDAMGAPTEMWNQWAIREEYGHVGDLDVVLREPSPEGPWDFNLPAGAGTDDTRWKALTVNFLVQEGKLRMDGARQQLKADRFATFINQAYETSVTNLRQTTGLEPEPLEDNMRRVTWLQEWAKVSRAYVSGDIDTYRNAMSKFYGGEMACAGMLYAPAIGAAFPGRPEAAYQAAYDLGIFDLGYARDITGMTAALTAAAFTEGFAPDTLKSTVRDVDPEGFVRSRLLGRVSYQQYRTARGIVRQARRVTKEDLPAMKLSLPDGYPYDSLSYGQTVKAYQLLGQASQDAPFHAGEIHLINLTALLMADLDFAKALAFVTNYGRDNDTVAAVTGAILGALHGYNALPEDQSQRVITTNREVLDIDLEALAWALTQSVLKRRPGTIQNASPSN